MTFLVLPQARDDIDRSAHWYRDDQHAVQATQRFLREVDRVFSEIRKDPTRYPARRKHLRYWPLKRFPFFVLYRFESDEIVVVSVKHTSRDHKNL